MIAIDPRVDGRCIAAPPVELLSAVRAARQAVHAADDVKRAAVRHRDAPLLKIAAGTTVSTVLGPALRIRLQQSPRMHIRVIYADNPLLRNQLLLDGEVDLALGVKPARAIGLEWRFLCQLELVLVSPLNLELPDAVPVCMLAEIAQITTPKDIREAPLDNIFHNAGLRPNVVLEAADVSIFQSLVQAGVGSYIGFRHCCEHLPGVRVRSIDPPQTLDMGLSYAPAKARQVKAFVDAAYATSASWCKWPFMPTVETFSDKGPAAIRVPDADISAF